MAIYHGYGGDVEVDDDCIVIRKTGVSAHLLGAVEDRRLPLQALRDVNFRAATRLVNGWIQVVVGDEGATKARADDPNTVLFRHKSRAQFEELRNRLVAVVDFNRERGVNPAQFPYEGAAPRRVVRLRALADRMEERSADASASDRALHHDQQVRPTAGGADAPASHHERIQGLERTADGSPSSGAGSARRRGPRGVGHLGRARRHRPQDASPPLGSRGRPEAGGARQPPRDMRFGWHHTAVVIGLLVLFFPLGLVLLWTKKDWSARTRAWLTGATAVWAAIVITAGSFEQPGLTDSTTGQPTASAPQTRTFTTSTSAASTPTTTPLQPQPGSALAVLATLAVKGRAPKTGYARDRFGTGWVDTNRNGCDTRNDMLRRDLVRLSIRAGTHGCVVLSGDLAPDPYTRATIHFARGGADEVDIDHVVALADAWQKGAASWPVAKRVAFANDPLNLLAVAYTANRRKGDGDAATWLPPNTAYRCAYVGRQVGVKAKYRLWVTAAERAAIARILQACPTQPAASGGLPTLTSVGTGAPTPTPRSSPGGTPPKAPALDPQFGTCAQAIAAGYGPYIEGVDPEYDWYIDRDHDGVVCEK